MENYVLKGKSIQEIQQLESIAKELPLKCILEGIQEVEIKSMPGSGVSEEQKFIEIAPSRYAKSFREIVPDESKNFEFRKLEEEGLLLIFRNYTIFIQFRNREYELEETLKELKRASE